MGWLAAFDAANGGQPVQAAQATPPARRPEPEPQSPPARDPRQMELPTPPAQVPRTPVVEQPSTAKTAGPGGVATVADAVQAIRHGVESMHTVVGLLTKAQENTTAEVSEMRIEMAEMRIKLDALVNPVMSNMQLLQILAAYMMLVGEGVLKEQGLTPEQVADELKIRQLETKPLADLLAALGAKQPGQ
jgi:hypothetical protein